MGKKVFISYKYMDTSIKKMKTTFEEFVSPTKVRDYVDLIQEKIGEEHINKGEKDGEDLSNFTNSTIASKLRDRIYDSSVTLVLLSPNMVDITKSEKEQWVPWEISYSLKEHKRNGITNKSNGILAVVLPDQSNSYNWFLEPTDCNCCNAILYQTQKVFKIIGSNMFNHNKKSEQVIYCDNHTTTIYSSKASFIVTTNWDTFISNPDTWIEAATNKNIDDYYSQKEVEKTK
jgi:hypothetical protein